MSKFDFIEAIKQDGVTYKKSHDCLEDNRFLYRFVGNDVQLAVKKNFDRWANSVDFVFAIPKTQKSYKRLRQRMDVAYSNYQGGVGKEIRL